MRLLLQGQGDEGPPLADQYVMFLNDGTFSIASYLAAGYDSYDAYVVGGGGGGGGGSYGLWTGSPYAPTISQIRGGGGGGGGGGGCIACRRGAVLAGLPATLLVEVGFGGIAGGIRGTGQQGGISQFGDDLTAPGGGGGAYGSYATNALAEGYGGGGGGTWYEAGHPGTSAGALGGQAWTRGGAGGLGAGALTVGGVGSDGSQDTDDPETFGGGGGGGGGKGANSTSFSTSQAASKSGNGGRGFGTPAALGGNASNEYAAVAVASASGVTRYIFPGNGGAGGGGANLTALTGIANLLGTGRNGSSSLTDGIPGGGGRGGNGSVRNTTQGGSTPGPGRDGYQGCVLVRVYKA